MAAGTAMVPLVLPVFGPCSGCANWAKRSRSPAPANHEVSRSRRRDGRPPVPADGGSGLSAPVPERFAVVSPGEYRATTWTERWVPEGDYLLPGRDAEGNVPGFGRRRRRLDFSPGLTRRLDYLARLGVNCLWLNPIPIPSPGPRRRPNERETFSSLSRGGPQRIARLELSRFRRPKHRCCRLDDGDLRLHRDLVRPPTASFCRWIAYLSAPFAAGPDGPEGHFRPCVRPPRTPRPRSSSLAEAHGGRWPTNIQRRGDASPCDRALEQRTVIVRAKNPPFG